MLQNDAPVADAQHTWQRDFHCNSTATTHTHTYKPPMGEGRGCVSENPRQKNPGISID